jgi:hypothetical protein
MQISSKDCKICPSNFFLPSISDFISSYAFATCPMLIASAEERKSRFVCATAVLTRAAQLVIATEQMKAALKTIEVIYLNRYRMWSLLELEMHEH